MSTSSRVRLQESAGGPVRLLIRLETGMELAIELAATDVKQLAEDMVDLVGEPTPATVNLDGLPVQFSPAAQEHAGRHGIDLAAVAAGFEKRLDEWVSPIQRGTSTAYVRVVTDSEAVAYYQAESGRRPYVVAIVPLKAAYDERRAAGTKSAGRSGPGSVSPKEGKPKTEVELLDYLYERGFSVERRLGGHLKITHPDAPGRSVTMAATASDWRAVENTLSHIKHEFEPMVGGKAP